MPSAGKGWGSNDRKRARRLGIGVAFAMILLADVRADVQRRPKLRIPEEHRIAAISGQEYEGAVEISAVEHAEIDEIELSGEGWSVVSVTPSGDTTLSPGETLRIYYRATPDDADADLTLTMTYDGLPYSRVFNIGPSTFARGGKRSPSVRADGLSTVQRGQVDPNPPTQRNTAGGQTLHIVGRIVFQRQGETAWTGADGIWFRIMDDDSPDPVDEEMYEGFTDEYGNFDVTFEWDDCDFGCDDPDIYLYYETDTNVVNVQSSDLLEEDYNWDTDSDPWDDFTGDFIDFGEQHPSDDNEYVPIFIHNSITRAHRFILRNININVEEVDVIWPESGAGSYYISASENIHIVSATEWNECTHIHEYGHHFLENYSANLSPDYCNGYCDNPGCTAGSCNPIDPFDNGGHCQWCPETNHDAWNEGWPYWLGGVIMRSFAIDYAGYVPLRIGDIRCNSEGLGTCCQDATTGAADITEGFATALLRDIEDVNPFTCSTSGLNCTTNPSACPPPQTCRNPDDHDGGTADCDTDWMNLGVDEIFKVVTDDLPTNPLDFVDKFRARFPEQELDLWYTARNVSTVYANYPQPAPAITSPPQDCSFARIGQPLTISVTSNANSNGYKWQREGVDVVNDARISGALTNSLTINPLAAGDAGTYTVVVSTCDRSQSATSDPIQVRAFPATGGGNPAITWGRDIAGELGLGSLPPGGYSAPDTVVAVNDFVAIGPGPFHTLGLKADGTVWGWGNNSYNQFGRTSPLASATPLQVEGLSDIVDVQASQFSSFALSADGGVFAWGGNFSLELGQVTPLGFTEVPRRIPDLDCVVEINSGVNSIMAIKSDGTVWTWGSNENGLLGLGYSSYPGVQTPTQVPGISDAINGTVGQSHMLVVRANGTILGWGNGLAGSLGNGVQAIQTSPVPAVGIDDVRLVADGKGSHSIAVKNDGTAWGFGPNQSGTLGVGNFQTSVFTPTQVVGLANVVQAATTLYTSVFRRADGTIWVTGTNYAAGLGTVQGTGGPLLTHTVIQLTALTNTTNLFAGGTTTAVLAPSVGVAIAQQPVNRANLVGQSATFSVAASGSPRIRYQWKRNNIDLIDGAAFSGTRAATLAINPVALGYSGTYTVAVSNASSSVTSSSAEFFVSELRGDFNGDGRINETDYLAFLSCFSAPGAPPIPPTPNLNLQMCLAIFDIGDDGDVDLKNFAAFQNVFDPQE